jgi:Tol biopolymer transport system component
MQKTIFAALFLLFLTLSCEKTDTSDNDKNKVSIRAVAGDQRVKLYFYLCSTVGGNFSSCEIDEDALFDVYHIKPNGTEIARLATNVRDSFEVSGLPNGVTAYFRVKARVGRSSAGESVAATTPDLYLEPPLLELPFSNLSNIFYAFSPDLNRIVQPMNLNPAMRAEILQFEPFQTQFISVLLSDLVTWDASSRYFMSVNDLFDAAPPTHFKMPYLYDFETDSLRFFYGLGKLDVQSPVLTSDRQKFYCLSNQRDQYEYGLWLVDIATSQKQQLATQLKIPYQSNDIPEACLAVSNDETTLYASFFNDNKQNNLHGLYQINPETGDVMQLLDNAWAVRAVRPSPNNQRLVFASYISGELNFWSMDLNTGNARQLTALPPQADINNINPIFWPDNNYVYVSVRVDGKCQTYNIKLN